MDYRPSNWEETACPQTNIEHALAGGAIGGLIGLLFGPLGTLACTALGAAIGYAAGWRIGRVTRSESIARTERAWLLIRSAPPSSRRPNHPKTAQFRREPKHPLSEKGDSRAESGV